MTVVGFDAAVQAQEKKEALTQKAKRAVKPNPREITN